MDYTSKHQSDMPVITFLKHKNKQTNTNKYTQNTREEDVFIKQHFWFRITKFELYELNTAQWISYQQKHIMIQQIYFYLSLLY